MIAEILRSALGVVAAPPDWMDAILAVANDDANSRADAGLTQASFNQLEDVTRRVEVLEGKSIAFWVIATAILRRQQHITDRDSAEHPIATVFLNTAPNRSENSRFHRAHVWMRHGPNRTQSPWIRVHRWRLFGCVSVEIIVRQSQLLGRLN
jgi:hypothetical protein